MVSIPEPVSVMSSQSIPIPLPPLGGIPYSITVVEVFGQRHRLLITGSDERDLRLETFSLHHRINRLETSRWPTQRIGCRDPITWPDRGAVLLRSQCSGVHRGVRHEARTYRSGTTPARTTLDQLSD
jgi:hypothetical protein